jgi:hypothetical protein
MRPTLALFEDVYQTGRGTTPNFSGGRSRMLYVVHGAIVIGGRTYTDGEAWHGTNGVSLQVGNAGATIWRWELQGSVAAPPEAAPGAVRSTLKLSADLDTLPAGDLLLRGDSVAFPPGGCAYRHVHQGPGIRCLIEGGIRIDAHGTSTSYGPGGAWYESGPEPVFAQGAADRPSRFIRVMILPAALLGKSSIRYVDEADRDRPKSARRNLLS